VRRFFILLICCLLLTTAVQAAGTVSSLQTDVSVASNGSCQISLVMQLSVTEREDSLHFPLPREARDISLNGSGVRTFHANNARWVDLSAAVYGTGTFPLTIRYSLPDRIVSDKNGLTLQLPLLSGFDHPINSLHFSITLPGAPENQPVFSSTYHPESMETLVDYTVDGPVISGYFTQALNDHESLTMTLPVSGKMFPQTIVKRWSLSNDDLARYGLTFLAIAYWLVFLRCRLPRRVRRVQAPDGITAGELGCCLVGQGVDFPAMVLSWAQMGYLTIHIDRNHRVLLHKGMEMGNERSDFEIRCFKTLFGRRRTVDGSSEHYGRLCRKAAKSVPNAWNYFKKSTGNPLFFRCLAAGIGAFGGISLAKAFAADTLSRVGFSIFLAALGAVLSWLIQAGAKGIHLRKRLDLLLALGSALIWLILGNLVREANVAIYVIVSQIIAGLATAYGGRRTEAGLQIRNEVLGLRRYFKTVSSADIRRITQGNPEYYFHMIPYAVALGVDSSFARHFGDVKLSPCPYLMVDGRQELTPTQWNAHFQQVLKVLDDRQYKKRLEKFLGK